MRDVEITTVLLEMEQVETAYKKLFEANPYNHFGAIDSWEEFVTEYNRKMVNQIEVPEKPLSDITNYFYENQFFSPKRQDSVEKSPKNSDLVYSPEIDTEVVIFKHLRFLPAFDHSLEFVKIVYVAQGKCNFYLNNKKTILESGSIVIICPNIDQSFFISNDDDIVINVIMRCASFEKLFSPLLSETNDISDYFWQMLYVKNFSHVLQFDCKNNSEIRHLILQLYYESQMKPKQSLIIINSYVLLLFGQIIHYHLDTVQTYAGKKRNKHISNILQYITNNKETVNLQQLSDIFSLSQGYLSRHIKEETGDSFSKLLQKIRLSEAEYLLLNSTMSVEEIVFRIGYTDVSHFYKIFKNAYKLTPNNYRIENQVLKEK